MKRILLTLTAVAGLTLASKAQEITGFQKGNYIVEGSLGLNTTDEKNTEVKTSNFNFTPRVGYFVTDKLAVGVGVNVGSESENSYASSIDKKVTANSFGVGVFGRYYFLELGSRFKTYAQVDVAYNSIKGKETIKGTSVDSPKVNGFGVNGSVGANYFLTNNIAINFAFANVIGFGTAKVDVDGAKSSNAFNLNVNNFNNFFNSAQFGLTFKF